MRAFSILFLTLAFNVSYYHIRIEVCEITLMNAFPLCLFSNLFFVLLMCSCDKKHCEETLRRYELHQQVNGNFLLLTSDARAKQSVGFNPNNFSD